MSRKSSVFRNGKGLSTRPHFLAILAGYQAKVGGVFWNNQRYAVVGETFSRLAASRTGSRAGLLILETPPIGDQFWDRHSSSRTTFGLAILNPTRCKAINPSELTVRAAASS